jgi:sRNA-binding regulator protein Hfq
MSKRIIRDSSRDSSRETSSVAQAAVTSAVMSAVMDPPNLTEEVKPSGPSAKTTSPVRKQRSPQVIASAKRFSATPPEEHGSNRQAELFYLQKQIQLQTQMVFILEDGARVQGVIEWYDRQSIKVRGKSRMLVYKSAIKYLYKAGEIGAAPEA